MDKIVKELNNQNFNSIKNNLETELDIENLQTYFPILSNYINDYDFNKVYNLKTKYMINKIIKNITPDIKKKKTPYINHFYNAQIYDSFANKYSDKNIFIKVNPLLDVTAYVLDQFNISNNILPDIRTTLTTDYINNFNNEAYIDSFFTYLGSKLTENGTAPSFPLFYGTFSCISNKFKFDITEEYSHIKYNNIFDMNKNKLFNIEEVEIDMDYYDSDYTDTDSDNDSDTNSEKSVVLEIINNNNLEFDDIDKVNTENTVNTVKTVKTVNTVKTEKKSSPTDLKPNLDNELPNSLMNTQPKDKSVLLKNKNSINIQDINDEYNFSDIIDDNNTFKYINVQKFPTQLICMEKLDCTLDDLIENEEISDIEWISILFQICFGLAVAQKKFLFVHNDLHSSNIMFTKTKLEYIYFEINNKYYKVPTFNRITKIIDFGRATFKHKNIIYFSSAFDENGDAEGQYDYPIENSLKNCKLKPNKSFDLARLSTTIIRHFNPESNIFKLLKGWMTDKYNKFLIYEEDDFDLYKKIAKNVKNAVPIKQLSKKIFSIFTIPNPKNNRIHVFKY